MNNGNKDIQIYYNGRTKTLEIDQGSRITTLQIPDELTDTEIRTLIQSQTFYDIITQLTDNE